MYKRQHHIHPPSHQSFDRAEGEEVEGHDPYHERIALEIVCLLYTSDAADERSSVDLGGRRIIKKKKQQRYYQQLTI